MKILTPGILLSVIPNYIASGYKEKPLLDKIQPQAQAAEDWTEQHISPFDIFNPEEDAEILNRLAQIAATKAILDTAPLLDVTMHPNGLAVVNTDSLAPASADRSREFRLALDSQLAGLIDSTIPRLRLSAAWAESEPAVQIWDSTIFPDIATMRQYCTLEAGATPYFQFRAAAEAAQDHIAERYISRKLMDRLRAYPYNDTPGVSTLKILAPVRHAVGQAAQRLKDGHPPITPGIESQLIRTVNMIRDNPDQYPEWHQSPTARLFTPPVFRNTKESGGYFF